VRATIAFVATVFALAVAVSVFVAATGGRESPILGIGYAAMLLPAFGAFLLRVTAKEGTRIDWSRLPISYVPVALLLMPAVMHAAMLPTMYAIAGRLPWMREIGWPHIILNAAVGLLVVSALALFEEIGWRGWLLPRLVEACGAPQGIVVTAIVWALWHIPFIWSGILSVEGFSVLRTIAVVPLGTFGAGLVIGWLWIRTRSIWIAALAHGALNDWGQYGFKYIHAAPELDLTPVLVAGSVALVMTGAILVARLNRQDS
jgi:membrane protease YdiL (CAAX protease family)